MKKIVITIIMFFIASLSINASSINTTLDCSPKTIYKNGIITCKVYITPIDFTLTGYQANYKITNGTYVDFTNSSSFGVVSSGNFEDKGIVLTSLSNITSKTYAGEIKIKGDTTPGKVSITLTRIKASNVDYGSVLESDITNEVELLFSLDKPSINSISYSYNKVTINIKEDKDATKYKIYKGTSSSKYKYLATTTSPVFEDTNVVVGKTYYYKVKSMNDEKTTITTSSYSDYKKVTARLSKPELLVSSLNATSVTLSWNKISGAHGYKIYRSTSLKGKYSLIKTITNGSTITYKNTGRITNKTYYYKIVAYRTVSRVKKYSSYSTIISAKPVLNTPVIESVITTLAGNVKISFLKVSYAHGYNVYRSTIEDGTYSYIGSTSKLYYYDTKASKGKNYYYKIKAYRKYDGTKKCSSSSKFKSRIYSEKVSLWYNETKEKKYVITLVGTTNCSYCTNFEPIVEEVSNENNISLLKFNMDQESVTDINNIANLYGIEKITTIPYILITYNGKMIVNSEGYMTKEELTQFLREKRII